MAIIVGFFVVCTVVLFLGIGISIGRAGNDT